MRSDTVTKPTEKMRKAMYEAVVGDDVYGDDPTINELEDYAAQLVGKESALFVPSGTFGNQLSLFTHCIRGQEVILGDDCHIVAHEVGAPAVIAGVQLRTIKSNKGKLDPNDIKKKYEVLIYIFLKQVLYV
ncbi:threonine aldolase [Clostridium tetanomorphum]|nr:threonine aldolase [Clostridium tetanomorphum]NRS84857.1 threonine aldolase [Clostridium tetanomorphum]